MENMKFRYAEEKDAEGSSGYGRTFGGMDF